MKLIADLHTHTLACTHAYSTITENAKAASEKGLAYLAMTDHGLDMPDAPHEWHFMNLRELPQQIFGVNILKGTELNIISYKGAVDAYDKNWYKLFDWIVASFHRPCCLPATAKEHTAAYINVLRNPYIDCIGHPDTLEYDFDIKRVCDECAKQGKVIELNTSHLKRGHSSEQCKKILLGCKESGAFISINSDAHFWSRVGDFEAGIQLVEEVDFPEELILNADVDRFEKYLFERKARIKNAADFE